MLKYLLNPGNLHLNIYIIQIFEELWFSMSEIQVFINKKEFSLLQNRMSP